MANATKGLRRVMPGKYVVQYKGDPVGLITKKGRAEYEAMRFGARPVRSMHKSVSDAVGTMLAEKVNAEPVTMESVLIKKGVWREVHA